MFLILLVFDFFRTMCTQTLKRAKIDLLTYTIQWSRLIKKKDLDYIMAKFGKVDHRVKDYLYNIGYDKWTTCHAPTNGGRMMTSNITKYQ